ncbi:Yip1 domain-containing protein [Colletotrichum acutatum]
MSNYYQPQQSYGPGVGGGGGGGGGAQNLQFYPSSYSPAGAVSGQATPQQASYGYGAQPAAAGGFGGAAAFGAPPGGGVGVSGRMGEQGGLRTGWLAAFSTEGYDGEPPLLEELGVNFGHIQAKTLAVLNPFRRIDQHLMDDADLFGPLLFVLSLTSLLPQYGTFLLLSGKIHFGYIYGLALLGSTSLHIILSLMTPTDAHPSSAPSAPQYGGPVSSVGGGYPGAPDSHHDHPSRNAAGHFSSTLTFTRSSSVLGYCLLPLVATSVFGVFMPMDTPLGIVFTTMAILWCTYSASGMFCAVGRMRGMRGLVAYPLALFYVGFGIMGIFSSRGSGGSLAKAAAGLKG